MSRVIKLNEADLTRIIRRIIEERNEIPEGRGAGGSSNSINISDTNLSSWITKTFGPTSFGTFASANQKVNFSNGKKTILYPSNVDLVKGGPNAKGSWKLNTNNVVTFTFQ